MNVIPANVNTMSYQQTALDELTAKAALITQKNALIGFDGFTDKIFWIVKDRTGPGDNFTRVTDMAEFAKMISDAVGKSTSIEMLPRETIPGGNSVNMALGLIGHGIPVDFVGNIGEGIAEPVFEPFAKQCRSCKTVGASAVTNAIEFHNGKDMLSEVEAMECITFENMVNAAGGEDALCELFDKADVLGLVNYTKTPFMNDVFEKLQTQVLPKVSDKPRRFFFDLADQQRTADDMRKGLRIMAKFEQFGSVTLGLNLKEAQQLCSVFDFDLQEESEAGLKQMASELRETLSIDCVVVHPISSAACAYADGTVAWIEGAYCKSPKITTGAGDRFNAGFVLGQALGCTAETCLALGKTTSGYYVRTAISPNPEQMQDFLKRWTEGSLEELEG